MAQQAFWFTLPSIFVFLATYIVLKTFLDREKAQLQLKLNLENAKRLVPLRLQAYERLVLLMERISPQMLIPRIYNKEMSKEQFHYALIQAIKQEYEHNLSQQIYVSDEAWNAVRDAKENIIRLINTIASDPKYNESVQKMSRLIIEAYSSVEETPTDRAIRILKNELQEIFG
jgi:hypothetical protein